MRNNPKDNGALLEAQIHDLGPWFHNLTIGGIQTAPDHFLGDYPQQKWQGFKHVIPGDLTGWTVLDVGCNAGFYSLEMKRRGADRVVGIDADARYLAQAEFAARAEGLDVEFRQLTVYELARLGERFDLVIFMGVLYHLRHPLLALDLLHEHVVGNWLLFQSMQRGSDRVHPTPENYDFSDESPFASADFPSLYFVEHRYADDPTNWFIPNRSAAEAMLRSAGFVIEAHPEPEVYFCKRGERPEMTEPPPI